jgi:hypothetical protein
MIASMVIGLRSCRSVELMSQGCRRRVPASIRISPGSPLRFIRRASGSALTPRGSAPGRQSVPLDDDRMPTPADFQAMRDAYHAVAPDPAHFDEFAARTSTMVHEFPGWTGELRSLQMPTLLHR